MPGKMGLPNEYVRAECCHAEAVHTHARRARRSGLHALDATDMNATLEKHNIYTTKTQYCISIPKVAPEPMLEEARKLTSSREILLWMTPSEAPKALQASECSELLDPMRASCWIFAQH